MKYRGKILASEYNHFDAEYDYPAFSCTELVKATPYGMMWADATTDEEDEEWGTSWDGFRICEYKIELQVMKERIRDYRQRLKGMQMMYNGVIQGIKLGENAGIISRMQRQMYAMNKELDKLVQEYKKKSSVEYLEDMLKKMRQNHIDAENELSRIKQAKTDLVEMNEELLEGISN